VDPAGHSPPLVVLRASGRLPQTASSHSPSSSWWIAPSRTLVATQVSWTAHSPSTRRPALPQLKSSYPYTARDGSCKSSYTAAIPKGGVTGYKDVSSESNLLDAVTNTGPVSVAIEADQMSFQMYSSGVAVQAWIMVVAVGFGTSGGTDYWKVKNNRDMDVTDPFGIVKNDSINGQRRPISTFHHCSI